jgi:hypothetical protein
MKAWTSKSGRRVFILGFLVLLIAVPIISSETAWGGSNSPDQQTQPKPLQNEPVLDAGRTVIDLKEDIPEPALDLKEYLEMEDPREAARALKELLQRGEIGESSTLKALKSEERQQIRPIEKIKVFNGTILNPAPGIERQLRQESEAVDGERGSGKKTVILQLNDELTLEDTLACLELGVKFFEQISRGAILAAVETDSIRDLASKAIFRWIGTYRPEYKYVPEAAVDARPDTFVYVLGGDRPEYRHDLKELGVEIKGFHGTPNCYHVVLDFNRFEQVSHLWWVKGISKPPRELPEAMKPISVNFEPNDSREFIMAYETTYTGVGVTIGVRDGAVYKNHPQLTGIFHASSQLTGSDDHGTHVAGIIAGRPKSVLGPWGTTEIKGVAPQANILSRLPNDSVYLDDFQSFISNGAQVSNHSYGFRDSQSNWLVNYDDSTAAYDAYCDKNDLIIIKSAGNLFDSRKITNPGTGKNVIAVGALNYVTTSSERAGERAIYSSQGPTAEDGRLKPELVAPGGGSRMNSFLIFEGVVSTSSDYYDPNYGDYTRLDGNYQDYEWESDDYFQRMSGTSMAAPHVTGILGKIKQWYPAGHSEVIKALLINTAIPLKGNSSDPLSGYANTGYGYGLVDGFSVTNFYPGESERLLFGEDEVTEDAREDTWTINVPAAARKLLVTLAYNDVGGEDQPTDALKDNLDLILIEPGTGRTFVASNYFKNVPGVTSQSPLEKMVITNPVSGAWTAKVKFVDSPDFLTPVLASQRYGLVAHAILKTPELSAPVLPQTTYNVGINQEFVLNPTITNIGGYIAAGVTVIVEGPPAFSGDVNKSRYLGSLLSQNAASSPQLKIKAPPTSGTYSLVVKADGVNKEFATASYPKQAVVTVNVTGTAGQVNRPAAGEVWNAGSTQTIAWSGFSDPYVKIELFKGSSLSATINSSAANSGAYTWTVPAGQAAGTDYRIKISSTANSALNSFSNYFTIGNSTPPASLAVTYPSAAGIRLEVGTACTITWSATGNIGTQVRVGLYKGVTSFGEITTANTGSYVWSIPINQELGEDYRIKVTSVDNPSISDFSDNYFTVYGPVPPSDPPTVTLVFPTAAGLRFVHGQKHNVTWSTTGNAGSLVKLELYKGAAFVGDVVTANNGSYEWTILPGYTPGSDYRQKISLVDSPDIYDWSDNYFTISATALDYSLSPDEGTIGTQATLSGSGYGSLKGKISIGGVKATVLSWSATSVEFLLKKPVPAGLHNLVVYPKSPRGAAPVTLSDCFTVKDPQIDSVEPSSGSVGQSVSIQGSFFGVKKGRVTLTDASGKAYKCKVVSWTMDPRTNSSQVVFMVPKQVYGRVDVAVVGKAGSGTVTDGFSVY